MVEIVLKTLECIIINTANIREIQLDGKNSVTVNGKTVKVSDPYKSETVKVVMIDGTEYDCNPITFHLIRVAHPIVQFNTTYTRVPEQALK